METLFEKRDKSKYYHFHNNYSNDIEDCPNLKEKIKELIRREYLKRFIRRHREPSL